MPRRLPVVLCLVALTVAAVPSASGARPGPAPTAPLAAAPAAAATADDPIVVVAVGDVACKPGARPTKKACQQARTARLAQRLDPDAVLALGDLQYERGTLRAFRRSYAKSWGALKGITYPVPGNHEYRSAAKGYYRYFDARQPGAPGYYAFDLGGWRVYALNSNCGDVSCTKEYRWLKKDLAANPRQCSLFTMHHPRFSSGSDHGSDPSMSRFFAIAVDNRVDLVLAGHDHDYERFRRKLADGTVDPEGVLSFVVGTGGRSTYSFGKVRRGSAYRLSGHFGVLRLALRDDRFRFAFRDVDGTVRDHGKRACR